MPILALEKRCSGLGYTVPARWLLRVISSPLSRLELGGFCGSFLEKDCVLSGSARQGHTRKVFSTLASGSSAGAGLAGVSRGFSPPSQIAIWPSKTAQLEPSAARRKFDGIRIDTCSCSLLLLLLVHLGLPTGVSEADR